MDEPQKPSNGHEPESIDGQDLMGHDPDRAEHLLDIVPSIVLQEVMLHIS